MQAAEGLGSTAEDVRPTVVDTDTVGYTDVTGGSRTTYATGYAAWKAANSMVDELKKRAALLWDISEDGVTIQCVGGRIRIKRVRPAGQGKIPASEWAASAGLEVKMELGS